MVNYIRVCMCLLLMCVKPLRALSKSHFIVAADDWSPFFEVDTSSKDTHYRGVMLQLLEYVQKSLNFTYEIRRPSDGQWGYVTKNGSVTGMVGMVSRKEVDFALGMCQSFVT